MCSFTCCLIADVIFRGLLVCFPLLPFGATMEVDEACALRRTLLMDTPCRAANASGRHVRQGRVTWNMENLERALSLAL